MDYLLKPGDLIFVHGTDLISEAIECVTKSKYSHVAIYVGNGKVIEAQGFRPVGYQDLSYYNGHYDVVRMPMSDTMLSKGIAWLNEQKVRPYDYWDIFALFMKLAFKLKIPWREGKAIICSRLGRDFLFACCIPIPDENMDPQDLYKWTMMHEGKLFAA